MFYRWRIFKTCDKYICEGFYIRTIETAYWYPANMNVSAISLSELIYCYPPALSDSRTLSQFEYIWQYWLYLSLSELFYCYPPALYDLRVLNKSGRNSSKTSALQTQYKSFIFLFSASKTYVMEFLVSDQVLYPIW